MAEVQQRGLDATCELIVSGCQGRCEYGPNMNIYPQLTKYEQLNAQKARRIVAEHLAGGQRVSEYMCQDDR
jgi:(2Fe-2S) ferredoxin